MVAYPGPDDLVRWLWRLPVWGPITRVIRSLRRTSTLAPNTASSDPKPLDGFQKGLAHGLWAGAARVDITPPRPRDMYLGGFGFDRTCTGVRDPIWARTLVLSDGTTPLVCVALDLVGWSLVRTERIRQQLTRRYPHSVLITSTHNHQSPDTLGYWGPALAKLFPYRTGLDTGYMGWLEGRILDSVHQAIEGTRPAKLFFAQGEFDRQSRWVQNERDELLDRSMRVMHLADEHDQGIATLIQHACHPETLWKQNRKISSDFCGVLCKQVEDRFGGVASYVNGALGAMVGAAISAEASAQEREKFLVDLGRAMGAYAVRLTTRARKKPEDNPSIQAATCPVRFPAEDNRLYGLIHALGVVEHRDLASDLVSEVSFVRVGPASIVALPGEAAPALGREILGRVPGKPRFLFGLANDELGYLLPPEFFHDPRYFYERSLSPGPQAAARLALAVEKAAGRAGG